MALVFGETKNHLGGDFVGGDFVVVVVVVVAAEILELKRKSGDFFFVQISSWKT